MTLPTISMYVGSIQLVTNMEDINIGEMFLNFMMHKNIRNFSGWTSGIYSPMIINWQTGIKKDVTSGNYSAEIL